MPGAAGPQVEADILACLDDGTRRAATLDVFQTEPLPQASSALDPSLASTITPHNAAMFVPRNPSARLRRRADRPCGGGASRSSTLVDR